MANMPVSFFTQRVVFAFCLTSAQLLSRFGDEKRVAEKARSLHAVHNFGGRTRLIDNFWQALMQEIG